jgi:hypothetical protein
VALAHTNGGHREGFGIRTLSPAQIRAQLDLVETFNARGKVFVGMIRAPASDTAALIYGYVACMIAGGPDTYCEFSDQVPDVPLIQADPGKPQTRYVTLPEGVADLNRISTRVFESDHVPQSTASPSPWTTSIARSALIEQR